MRTFVEASFVERPDEASLQHSRQNDHKTSREDKHHAAAASAVARSNVKRTPPGRAPAIRRIRSGMSSCQIQMHLSRGFHMRTIFWPSLKICITPHLNLFRCIHLIYLNAYFTVFKYITLLKRTFFDSSSTFPKIFAFGFHR